MTALKLIYDKLHKGEVFGKIDEHRLGGTYFWQVLNMDFIQNLICYRHCGSSATKDSLKNLEWVITEIFDETPESFLYEYTTYHEWERINNCYRLKDVR